MSYLISHSPDPILRLVHEDAFALSAVVAVRAPHHLPATAGQFFRRRSVGDDAEALIAGSICIFGAVAFRRRGAAGNGQH